MNVDYMLDTMPNAYEMTNLGVGITEVKVQVTPDNDVTQILGQAGVGLEGWADPDVASDGASAGSSYLSNRISNKRMQHIYDGLSGFGNNVEDNISSNYSKTINL